MKQLSTIANIKLFLTDQKKQKRSIGFVPTMGALHEGHLELMRQAKRENDLLVVSIFVNPIQFNNPEDLKKYPRDLKKDIDKLQQVGCDVLFSPEIAEMYPEKVDTNYDFGPLGNVMEGAFRQGHFNGVAIVVKKLFEIIQPDKAYFGEKDFQQLAIIKKLVEMEDIQAEIIPCDIVREKDGLAMSSRNERLTDDERNASPFIYQTLLRAKQKSAAMSPELLIEWVKNRFEDHPSFELEYFEIAEDLNLQPVQSWEQADGIVGFVAVNIGKIRLIDNIRFI